MLRVLQHTFLFVLFGALASSSVGQSSRLIPLDHWAYEYVQRLQRRGFLLDLHPTALPYTVGDVQAALKRIDRGELRRPERRWADLLFEEFDAKRRHRKPSSRAGIELQPGIRVGTHERLDPLRPLDGDESTMHAFGLAYFPNADLRLFLERGHFVAQAGIRFDVYYRDDPDGLDASNRLVARNEDSYAGFGSKYFSAYLGRFKRHWGPYDEPALLVSHNPVGMDQIGLRIGGPRLSLRSMLGELDSMTLDERFTGTAGADSIQGSVRRFIAAHRFDWRPSRHFGLSLMESTIYSSESSGLSLKFFNPLNLQVFSVDGRPKNDENNGLLAGILWAQFSRWTVHGQLMIDDIDIMSQSGEPASAALSGSITYAGLPGVDIGGGFTAVTARAYNTHQPEGRYIFLVRGIGTQFSDYVQASTFASFYLGTGDLDITVRPKFDVLLQGSRDIRQPYPRRENEVDLILHGDVVHTFRPAVELRLQQARRWWFHLDIGPAFSDDEMIGSAVTATASLTARIGFSDRVHLSL